MDRTWTYDVDQHASRYEVIRKEFAQIDRRSLCDRVVRVKPTRLYSGDGRNVDDSSSFGSAQMLLSSLDKVDETEDIQVESSFPVNLGQLLKSSESAGSAHVVYQNVEL